MEPNGCVYSFQNSSKWESDNGSKGTTTNTASVNPTTKKCATFLIQPSYTNIKWDRVNYYRVLKLSWTKISYNSSKNHYTFDAHCGATYKLRTNAMPGNEHMTMN